MGLFDRFKKNETSIWDGFVKKYEASRDLVKPSEHILKACKSAGFPDTLLDFMKTYGFGNYGNGIVKLIDPEEYMNGLYTWLGGQDFSKIPFMMTGFGDIYYFRNLGDGNHDISMLDIHYRNTSVPAWTIKDFVSYITAEETEKKILRKDLFQEAITKCGYLEADEIYYFAPALIIGGAEDVKCIDKGKANVHHQVLFQIGNQNGKGSRTLADDIPASAEWARNNLNSTGYKVDYDLESMREVERFFAEQSQDGGVLIPGECGSILFGLGCFIGETIIKISGGGWETDDTDPEGEINIAVRLPDNSLVWPVQRCMKRLKNGSEDNIYDYVCVMTQK